MTVQLPSLELIEASHTFPGLYTFKIIGDSRDDFVADALTQAMAAIGQDREFNHSIRASSSGNHTALTLSVRLENAREVHAVYEKLLKIKGIRALF
jgi:putative lipoic acid-binding regulatory protein